MEIPPIYSIFMYIIALGSLIFHWLSHILNCMHSRGRGYWGGSPDFGGTPSNQNILCTDIKIEEIFEIGQKSICGRCFEDRGVKFH